MASPFARSASSPSGLFINTGTANSAFGNNNSTNQPQAAGVLFGGSAQPSQPAQAGGLFGTSTTQAQSTGSAFGNPQQNTGGGLFGSTNLQSAAPATQPQASGGLFGSNTTTQSQSNGGLLGAATVQPQATGSVFGNSSTTAQAGSVFGSTNTAQPQQSTGGLFGSTSTGQPQQSTGGLFGASAASQPQQQPNQTGGLLAAPQGQNTGGLFGMFGSKLGGLGGLNQPANQSTVGQPALGSGFGLGQSNGSQRVEPGARIDLSNLRGTTRFNDLHEELQKAILQIDEDIQKFIRDKEAVDVFMPKHGEQLLQIPIDVGFVTRKSDGAQHALSSDVAAVNELRELAKDDADSARLSFKVIDNLKLPSQYHQAGLWTRRGPQDGHRGDASAEAHAETNTDLIGLFSKTADHMEHTMTTYAKNLDEIETHLHGVQANIQAQMQKVAAQSKTGGGLGSAEEKLGELAGVLRDFEESIFQVAAMVGSAREGMTELQLKEFMGSTASGLH